MATLTQSTSVDALEVYKRTSPALIFESFDLSPSNQRQLGAPHPAGTLIPLALRPSRPGIENINLDDIITTVKELQSRDEILTKKLALHGTLLFRGMPIHNADDFSRFAHAFGFRPHEIIGIVVNRPELAPNVTPASEAPKEVLIHSHNESPQVPHAPEYVFFYAHKVPSRGGETPMSSSLELFHRAREEIPEFITDLTAKGLLSRVTYMTKRLYPATQRSKIEAQIARYGRGADTTWQWLDNDEGIVVSHRLPAIRTQPGTNLPTLFTGLALFYKDSTVDDPTSAVRKNITEQLYGDGTPIPERYLKRLVAITNEIRVLHRWEQGDVLVYDNIIAQHGRQPWEGKQTDRVVMASLFDGDQVPGAYGDADWAQVVQALEG